MATLQVDSDYDCMDGYDHLMQGTQGMEGTPGTHGTQGIEGMQGMEGILHNDHSFSASDDVSRHCSCIMFKLRIVHFLSKSCERVF